MVSFYKLGLCLGFYDSFAFTPYSITYSVGKGDIYVVAELGLKYASCAPPQFKK